MYGIIHTLKKILDLIRNYINVVIYKINIENLNIIITIIFGKCYRETIPFT